MKPWESSEEWIKHKVGPCRHCLRKGVCRSYKAGQVAGCSGLFSPAGEEVKEPDVDGIKFEGEVKNLFNRTAKNGKPYWVINADGMKLMCWFNPNCRVGDWVEGLYQTKGEYHNIVSLRVRV